MTPPPVTELLERRLTREAWYALHRLRRAVRWLAASPDDQGRVWVVLACSWLFEDALAKAAERRAAA